MMAHLDIALALAVTLGWSGALGYGAPTARQRPADALLQAEPGTDSVAEPARVRAAIAEVLARKEFADLHADPNAFSRWLVEWIESLLRRISSAIKGLPHLVLWVIVAWMVLTLLAILAHLVYTLWKFLGGAGRPSLAGPSARRPAGELLGIRDLDFDSVYADACRLLAAGEWLAATKHLYVAAILWLDRQGWIAFRPAKTNRDYLGELQSRSHLQGPFRRLTEGFESIVYGGQSATASAARDMAGTVEGLLHEPVQAVAS